MYLLYVDESGDIGLGTGSPTRFFCLCGLVVHELRWHATLEALTVFRQNLRQRYGLKMREEIHAAHFLHHPGPLRRLRRFERLAVLRETLEFQASLPDINVLSVVLDKQGKPSGYDVFEKAWTALVQRFHNTISYKNFPDPQNPADCGLLVVDRTDEPKLRSLTRRMRRYNPVPNAFGPGYRQIPVSTLAEDAVHRDSLHSYLLQLADVDAYFLKQKVDPSAYIRSKNAESYFDKLDPVLCKAASRSDPQGIVRL